VNTWGATNANINRTLTIGNYLDEDMEKKELSAHFPMSCNHCTQQITIIVYYILQTVF
jgi:hypothetical protein